MHQSKNMIVDNEQKASRKTAIDSSSERETKSMITSLMLDGYINMGNILSPSDFSRIVNAVEKIEQEYPYGFVYEGMYSQEKPRPRASMPKSNDRVPTIIYPDVGFLDSDILLPLAYTELQKVIERAIGGDYYLSNTWLQTVPSGTGRLGYHKDPRGSITFMLMLDHIDKLMGSTCLVPASHINTPPPVFCMRNIEEKHSKEIELIGKPGDIIFFSPETWHGRSANMSSTTTRRLFFNFYNRASRETTSWAKSVDIKTVAEIIKNLPDNCQRMFEIDKDLSKKLQQKLAIPNHSTDGSESHKNFFKDIRHSRKNYGSSTFLDSNKTYLKPYTCRFMELSNFIPRKYISHLKIIPTGKIIIKYLLRQLAKSNEKS